MYRNIGILAAFLFLFSLTGSAQAAELNHPYSSLVSGLDNIQSAKHTIESTTLIYDKDEPIFANELHSKGAGLKTSSTTYDSSSSITTLVADTEEGVETKMDFVRKGEDIYIRFKYGPVKNKWIHLKADQYASFGEAIDLETEFDLAEISDPNGEDEILMKKLATLAEKHNLYVDYKEPVTKKKKGKSLTTYSLEFNRNTIVPYFTEAAAILTEEEKEGGVLGIEGFMDSLKSKVFVDILVEESFVRIVFDETSGLPIEYTEKIIVPEHNKINLSLEQTTYMKFDNINKKVTVKAPTKFISSDKALQLMGLED